MSKIVVEGTALYLRNMHGAGTSIPAVEKAAAAFAKRAQAMGLSWMAIGAIWQDLDHLANIDTRFLNSPGECAVYRKALRDVGIVPYVWGYPWLGGESKFLDGMAECAGADGLYLLDPELGANPSQRTHATEMIKANAGARLIVDGLRARGARVILLSTFGGVPKWFPLRAYLKANIDGAGGQTYTDDARIDGSIATFAREMREYDPEGDAQVVPNFGTYARVDGKVRSKTAAELRTHLDEFVNEGEDVRAAIGWAENFVTPAQEPVLAEFAVKLRARC
jgi:hypothetical protein